MKEREHDGKPWMIHLGLLMPHWPFALPQEYFDMYADVEIPWPHDAKFPNEDMHPALQHFQKWDGLDVPPDEEKLPAETIDLLRVVLGARRIAPGP